MDARENPYAPGAGTKPPALTGRDGEIEAFEIMLERLRRGAADQSMILRGLRGVGKTVLLNTFEDLAVERDWLTVFKECEESTSLPGLVARHCRRLIDDLGPGARVKRLLRSALDRLSTFTVVDPNGFELRFDLGRGKADTDSLSDDFTDLLVALGAAADERGRGVLFLLDEVQFLHPAEFGPFVVGLHRINQKALPLTCVAAGLPSLPALAGEAKSYAERLFTYPAIDRLDREAADEALARPAWARQVAFSKSALAAAYDRTRGYPYFIQECGKYTLERRDRIPHRPSGTSRAAGSSRATPWTTVSSSFASSVQPRRSAASCGRWQSSMDLRIRSRPSCSCSASDPRASSRCSVIR